VPRRRSEPSALLAAASAGIILFVLVSAAIGVAGYSPLQSLLLVLKEPGVVAPAGSSMQPLYVATRSGTRIVIVEGVNLGAIGNSVLVAALASAVSTTAAVAAASLAYLYSSARKTLFLLLPFSMLSFPFVDAYIVKRVLSVDYGLPAWLASAGVPVVIVPRGLAGVAVYEALAVAPYAVAMVSSYMLTVPRGEVEAAIQLGARGLSLYRLLASLSKPAVVASIFFTAVLVLDDVGGPLVFSDDPLARTLLSYRAYKYFIAAATGGVNSQGLGYTVLLLLVSAPLVAAGVAAYQRLTEAAATAKPEPPPLQGGVREAALTAAILAPPLALRVLSALYAFSGEWLRSPLPRLSLDPWRQLAAHPDLVRAAVNSSLYAALVSAAALFLAAYAAWRARLSGGPAAAAARIMHSIPVLIPGLVVAYGLYLLYAGSGSLLDPLRNPAPLLLLGYYTRRAPLLYHAAEAVARAVPASLYEAALGLGASPVRAYAAAAAPLMASSIAAPLLYTALSVAGEVSLSATIGGLAGAEGFNHPAPLMYLVASYMGFSGLRYAPLCAAATLLAYSLAAVFALTALGLYLVLARKSYR